MALFSKKESISKIEALEAQIADFVETEQNLTKQLEATNENVITLTQEKHAVEEKNSVLEREVSNLKQEVQDLTETKEAQEDKLSTFDDDVEARAIEIAAAQGAEPPLKNVDPVKSDDEVMAQYKSLPAGKERAEFRKKHINKLK